jgi:hypothetical protein
VPRLIRLKGVADQLDLKEEAIGERGIRKHMKLGVRVHRVTLRRCARQVRLLLRTGQYHGGEIDVARAVPG